MATFQNFTGINNVQPAERLGASELSVGTNVDLDAEGKLRRRAGYAEASALRHENLHQAASFLLATRGTGDLVNVDDDVTLYAALGHDRVWYCNLPDGRTAFSNGLITGLVSATERTAWGVPVPDSVGSANDVPGGLHAGDYQWSITYVRTADGIEGGPAYCDAAVAIADGGIVLAGLPQLDGHTIRVYLTSHFGGERYLAGTTSNGMFSFTGSNTDLVRPCATEFLRPAPVGKLLAFWRGRALVAVGNTLYASLPNRWESFHMRRDFKHFAAPITLVQPVADGIYVGTEKELAFLAGTQFDQLAYVQKVSQGVVLGSGVEVEGRHIQLGKGVGDGQAMVCIAGGIITAGFAGGTVVGMTEDRYTTDATEVAATFRVVNEVPQYMAAVVT